MTTAGNFPLFLVKITIHSSDRCHSFLALSSKLAAGALFQLTIGIYLG
jgi:hypothetical protein